MSTPRSRIATTASSRSTPCGTCTTYTNQPRRFPPSVGAGQPEALDARQRLRVERRDPRPRGEQLVEPLQLSDAERAGEVVEPVVEAQPVVVEPAHVGRPALVALGVDALLDLGRRRQDGAALARRDLLVRVEAEHAQVAASADLGAVGVGRPERLAGVLHDPEPAVARQQLELRHVDRVAEDVHRQDPGGPLGERVAGRLGGHVERARVDVAEHRPGALVEQAVRRGHEAERRRDNVVAVLDAGRADRQVEARGARRDGRDVRAAGGRGE